MVFAQIIFLYLIYLFFIVSITEINYDLIQFSIIIVAINDSGNIETLFEEHYDLNKARGMGIKLRMIRDGRISELLLSKLILSKWALSCVQRVINVFESRYPYDKKLRKAVKIAKKLIYALEFQDTQQIQICKKEARVAANEIFFANYEDNIAHDVAHAVINMISSTIDGSPAYTITGLIYAIKMAANVSKNPGKEIIWQRNKLWEIVVNPWYEFQKGYYDPKNQISRLPMDIIRALKEY
jgi:hypothetical protein